jgi:hypothetical protein
MFDQYNGSKGQEFILSFGDNNSPQIVFLAPLFEEANRMRRPLAKIMRHVSEAGFRTLLPDIPGCGESSIELADVDIEDWRTSLKAFQQNLAAPILVVSFRSAALFDDALDAKYVWRCAPENGKRLIRDLLRTRLTAENSADEDGEYLVLAGNKIKKSLVAALETAEPLTQASVCVAQLETSATQADVRLPGSPLWRRSEPGEDPILQDAIANSIIEWARACAN